MQTVIVSLIALVALAFVTRKVVSAIRPPKGQAACPSCASGSDACATTTSTTTPSPQAR
jgi:hypothetical protein